MKRKDFLKQSLIGLGFIAILPISNACTQTGHLATTPEETEGPFPTKNPSSLTIKDIKGDRIGIPLTIHLTIQNENQGWANAKGIIVDIWHCDSNGYYSEYGGSGMQSIDMTNAHFLRGRQVSNEEGQVSFDSIFPGWYPSRAPHIHVHIYDNQGKSLLISQIAFPTSVCDTVYTEANQYYKKGKQETSNAGDNVFSNSLATELATITGNVKEGYHLTHKLVINA